MRFLLPPPAGNSWLMNLVDAYNREVNDSELQNGESKESDFELERRKAFSHVKRLFFLQQIVQVFQSPQSEALIAWFHHIKKEGLEAHLQYYGIHRDASVFLQEIEFANAVKRFYPEIGELHSQDLLELLQWQQGLLKEDNTWNLNESILYQYIQCNSALAEKSTHDPVLQERQAKHREVLAVCYAKMESIRGVVQQEFEQYQTAALGEQRNNKNFLLNIGDNVYVIRVEDRENFRIESDLSTKPVSQYFSEDYAVWLQRFKIDNQTVFRPVVISEFASQGDLFSFAARFMGDNHEVVRQTQDKFVQITDFCLKLIQSGCYDPDIKLTNFLTDGKRVFLSDRKAFTSSEKPRINTFCTTPAYSAPEFFEWMTEDAEGFKAGALKEPINMTQYMSYQVGIAMKEFLLLATGHNAHPANLKEWYDVAKKIDPADHKIKNLSILIQELTRKNPEDRLSLEVLHPLLQDYLNLDSERFLETLIHLSIQDRLHKGQPALSVQDNLNLLHRILTNPNKWSDEEKKQLLTWYSNRQLGNLVRDPRLGVTVGSRLLESVRTYRQTINSVIKTEDYAKASLWRKFLSWFGVDTPRVTTLDDLTNLPDFADQDTLTEVSAHNPMHRVEASEPLVLRHPVLPMKVADKKPPMKSETNEGAMERKHERLSSFKTDDEPKKISQSPLTTSEDTSFTNATGTCVVRVTPNISGVENSNTNKSWKESVVSALEGDQNKNTGSQEYPTCRFFAQLEAERLKKIRDIQTAIGAGEIQDDGFSIR